MAERRWNYMKHFFKLGRLFKELFSNPNKMQVPVDYYK